MSIKEHYLYPIYIAYIKSKRMSNGALELSSISESSFFEFKYKYEYDTKFHEMQENRYRSVIREDRINILIDDNEPKRAT